MTRRLSLALLVALLAATPLAAQDTDPQMAEPTERAEEGMLTGTVVLLDDENLIIETAEGDRAFSIDDESELPAELRDADDWSTFNGSEVEVAFVPGADGELRVVRTLTLVSPTGATATVDTDVDTAVEPMPETDLADQSQLVEPDEVDTTAEVEVDVDADLDVDTDDELTAGEEIAAANPPQDDDDLDTASGLVDDDEELPPVERGDTLASLPETASPLPWIGLLGTLALFGALGLGWYERRRATVRS